MSELPASELLWQRHSLNDFSQKVEDFSIFFEIGSFRPWRRRRWSRLAERSPKPVSPTKVDKGKWVSDDTRKIRRFSRRTPRPGYWPVIRLGNHIACHRWGHPPEAAGFPRTEIRGLWLVEARVPLGFIDLNAAAPRGCVLAGSVRY